jgi:ssDNA-binding Zn-finger/Zn-ribbon topoisomerase 1
VETNEAEGAYSDLSLPGKIGVIATFPEETFMKCPNCDKDLVQTKRDDIDAEYCPSCRGMWLSRQELG